jgi:hypothetical protein
MRRFCIGAPSRFALCIRRRHINLHCGNCKQRALNVCSGLIADMTVPARFGLDTDGGIKQAIAAL